MRSPTKLLSGLALALSSSLVAAQSNLGELLDAGARRLPTAEFKEQIVQHTIVGPAPAGGTIEVMYVTNGTIQGVGTVPATPQGLTLSAAVRGEWTIDERERVCTTMQIVYTTGPGMILARRCQAWFKLGDDYFLSDSDLDRGAKVLRRTIKPSPVVAPQNNLGALLDAGAKQVLADEFRREVVRRTLVGPTSMGEKMEIVYAADGSLRGQETLPIRSISGKWTIDESARICTSAMRIGALNLPNRCEYWFKLGEIYYVSESDTDRRAYRGTRTGKSDDCYCRNMYFADHLVQQRQPHVADRRVAIGARPAAGGSACQWADQSRRVARRRSQ